MKIRVGDLKKMIVEASDPTHDAISTARSGISEAQRKIIDARAALGTVIDALDDVAPNMANDLVLVHQQLREASFELDAFISDRLTPMIKSTFGWER